MQRGLFQDQNIVKHYNPYLKEDLKFKLIILELNSIKHTESFRKDVLENFGLFSKTFVRVFPKCVA